MGKQGVCMWWNPNIFVSPASIAVHSLSSTPQSVYFSFRSGPDLAAVPLFTPRRVSGGGPNEVHGSLANLHKSTCEFPW